MFHSIRYFCHLIFFSYLNCSSSLKTFVLSSCPCSIVLYFAYLSLLLIDSSFAALEHLVAGSLNSLGCASPDYSAEVVSSFDVEPFRSLHPFFILLSDLVDHLEPFDRCFLAFTRVVAGDAVANCPSRIRKPGSE